ncbi:hypothetical protein [Novosphingobium sp. Chol11]|uniref:hypothetical protein n=1 Tax=Novosphingobium sp. Chol11 TaxID=1385763 RepID=UPI000BE416BD|nr:hypothetical protein [Novosphingobium sp. Chol11]
MILAIKKLLRRDRPQQSAEEGQKLETTREVLGLPAGYHMVLDSLRGGYTEGFDPNKMYRFRRPGWAKSQSFRLRDQGPYFNVAALYWRDPFA